MTLYLVQHAEAKTEQEDPSRGFSEQTAWVLAEYLHPDKGVAESDGLNPMDEPEIWAERLSSVQEDIMLVGHLPHLGRLAALLVCGNKDRKVVNFKTAGIT